MRTAAAIILCIALSVTYTRLAIAAEQNQGGSPAGTEVSDTSIDQLHFVSVLALRGEVVAVSPADRRITIKRSNGGTATLEARRENDLESIKVGDHITVSYFEGAQIRKRKWGKTAPDFSLKDGMISATLSGPSRKEHVVVASVEAVDTVNQEIALKGPDGSLETIMVANPDYLGHIKVGDQVGLTRVQALALSFEKAG